MDADRDQRLAHILAIPFPLQGHIAPMLHLVHAILLTDRAVVWFITSESHAAALDGKRSSWFWQGVDASRLRFIGIAGLSTRLVDDQGRWMGGMDAFRGAMAAFMRTGAELAAAVEALPRIDCIVADYLSVINEPLCKLQVPLALLWTCSASLLAVLVDLPRVVDEGYIPLRGGTWNERTVEGIPGIHDLQVTDLPFMLYSDRHDPGFKLFSRAIDRFKGARFAMVNACQELEGEVLEGLQKLLPNLIPVGPLVTIPDDSSGGSSSDAGLWNEDLECIRWLDWQPEQSVVYISFGSMSDFQFEEIESIAQAIEDTGHPFLWVLRQGVVRDMPPDFFESFVSRTRSQGMVVSWAPQSQVLSHRSVAAFFTHCGWNSCLEAIVAGVPMLALPRAFEQSLNAKTVCDDWKAGVRLLPKGKVDGIVNRKRVEVGIKAAMENQVVMRTRACDLRKQMQDGPRNLHCFIDSLLERTG